MSSSAAAAAAVCLLSLASSPSSSAAGFVIAVPSSPPMTTTLLRLYQEDGAPYPPSVGGNAGPRSPSSKDDGGVDDDDAAAAAAAAAGIADDNGEIDFVGAGTLGDIMAGGGAPQTTTTPPPSSCSQAGRRNIDSSVDDHDGEQPPVVPVLDGLVTGEAGGGLDARFGCAFSPMERIALTANGNLQRILSSYYDAPVCVRVDRCSRRKGGTRRRRRRKSGGGAEDGLPPPTTDADDDDHEDGDATWDRIVRIQVRGATVCRATSVIRVRCTRCRTLIEEGTVGIAQMFRYLDRLPTFSLLDAGRRTEGGVGGGGGRERGERGGLGEGEGGEGEGGSSFDDRDDGDDLGMGGVWRTYELQSEEMTCLIHEEFRGDAWNII